MSSTEESDTKFSVMVSLFNWMQKSKSSVKKRSKFRKFLDAFCRRPADYFSSIRLILPVLDRERGSYGLKEHALATCLIDALGVSRDSSDAQRLLNWRKGGPKTGSSAGNFSLVAFEVLQRRQGLTSGGMTLKELNELLDRLSSSENRVEKTSVLSDLIRRTNAQEMKWIIMIILKDLKLGISERSIFHEFHPDAEDLFNVTCDLKLVCEKLRDRSQRHKRQDIEVGKPVRPQLALRVSNASAAFKKLHGKEVVVECKLDGDRIQIHKNRNFLDHPEYEHAMSEIITKNILADRCILDGEMLVWDTSENRFADFGSNQEIAKAARDGLDSDRQMCYVAFDILYVGDTSVIHQTLKERHDLLRKVVKPIKGRLEILVPNGGLDASRPSGEPCRSFAARSLDEVEKFFKETIENRDEGIVLKDLASKWEPSDRSGKWLKLKPEYVRAGSDLDVLIIGGYYGSGRHGGEIAQFLVGLAERSMPNTHPRRFISFCRVGTGLSDEELDRVVTKLKPYFRKYEYPKMAAPSFYQVTNNSKERPDVWIESPEKSVIVSITSDIRTIKSEVFAAPYSLRFPRIDRVRFDKPWFECLDVQTFVELVHSSNGTTQREEGYGEVQNYKSKRLKSAKEKNVSVVPSNFIQTDVSTVKGETRIFSKMIFYFANVPSSHSLELFHKMVVENGGNFSMNLNNSVTHCIAAENRGIKFQAAKLRGDVIHYTWLLDCCLHNSLLPLRPKYFLYLSEPSKRKLEEEIDEFSDSYYLDVEIADIRQLLNNIGQTEYPNTSYYKKKYCPKEKWACFQNCCFYFYFPALSVINSEWKVLEELAIRRMKIAVSFGGGGVADDLSHATHVIVLSVPELAVDFNSLFSSLSDAEKHLLLSQRTHVVSSQWLEDCIEKEQKLPEKSYSLKPCNIQDWVEESDQHELNDRPSLGEAEDQNIPESNKDRTSRGEATTNRPRLVNLPKKERKMKRGRSSGTGTTREKSVINQPRRVRARGGNKPAKINEDESDGSGSSSNLAFQEESKVQAEKDESSGMIGKPYLIQEKQMIEDIASSQKGKAVEQYPDEQSGRGISVIEDHEIGSGRRNAAEENLKPEQLADTVEAMLLHMIPSLGNTKAKSEDHVRDEKLESKKARGMDPAFIDERSSLDPNSTLEKRRKVSYKDIAGELLKDDW